MSSITFDREYGISNDDFKVYYLKFIIAELRLVFDPTKDLQTSKRRGNHILWILQTAKHHFGTPSK